MRKILSYPLSLVYYLCFILCLLIFHPIQWLCYNLLGYQAHKKTVDYLNLFLVRCTNLLGTRYTIIQKSNIPKNVPLIFVANHQSLYDIVGIIWYFRAFHPKFISKKELGKGIPSVSYNLRHGGSVLIDRKDSKQALPAIKLMAQYIEKTNRTAVIFPEGTRSKTGDPKKFAVNGLKILCKYSPSAYIVPITINNSWKMVKYGLFPMGLGTNIQYTIHDPIPVKQYAFDELMLITEQLIVKSIKN